MRKAIAALEKVGHIHQIHDGRWLFKAVLAPKPHQEHVENIGDFVWRFCVNYSPTQLSYMHYCLPNPMLRFCGVQQIWQWPVVVVI
jgi:hypothetical protein